MKVKKFTMLVYILLALGFFADFVAGWTGVFFDVSKNDSLYFFLWRWHTRAYILLSNLLGVGKSRDIFMRLEINFFKLRPQIMSCS